MQLVDLPTEIILAVFRRCSSIADVTNFSQVCRRIYSLLFASQKTLILYLAAESQFGPVHDIVQLLTVNGSQPASSIRDPPRSDALLRQIVAAGHVAQRWEELYPLLRWDSDFANRRSLSAGERYRMRRAFYRYWLYARAFHNPAFPRTARRLPQIIHQRALVLQKWSTSELIELEDFQNSMRTLISTQICPNDCLAQALCYPDGMHSPACRCKQSASQAAQDYFHTAQATCVSADHITLDAGTCAGWGDPVTNYYVVEDLLKLSPEAVLWLYDHPRKWQVEHYLDSLGEWFFDNGDTFSETLAHVLERREPDLPSENGYPHFGIVTQACALDESLSTKILALTWEGLEKFM